MKSPRKSWMPWGCAMACALGGCKPRQAPIPVFSTAQIPVQRSALLTGTIAMDSEARVTRDSLIVHGCAWMVPTGWVLTSTQEHPRIAQVRTSGGLEILVFSFGRGGGTIQANLQRWREQVPSVQDSSIEIDTLNGLVRAIGRWTGDYRGGTGSAVADGSLQTLLGAVVEGPGGRIFFKAVGKKEAFGKEGDRIVRWIRSGTVRS